MLVSSNVRFNREALELLLPEHGAIEVVAASASVEEALELGSAHPEVVVLDAALPDGFSAIGRLRAAFRDALVVVVASGGTVGQSSEVPTTETLTLKAETTLQAGKSKVIVASESEKGKLNSGMS